MKIYTKAGDSGETSLPSGERVAKDHPLVEILGSLEEIAALLGFLASMEGLPGKEKSRLEKLVSAAMDAIASAAAMDKAGGKREKTVPLKTLEHWIDEYEKKVPEVRTFVLPYGSRLVSTSHLVRTSVRRIERTIVKAGRETDMPSWILAWVNRLSDFLFVLALYLQSME